MLIRLSGEWVWVFIIFWNEDFLFFCISFLCVNLDYKYYFYVGVLEGFVSGGNYFFFIIFLVKLIILILLVIKIYI